MPEPGASEAGIEVIRWQDDLLGIIVRHSFSSSGVSFFTPDDLTMQMGYMRHSKGHEIQPHCHNLVTRTVTRTCEALLIKSGRMQLDLYSNEEDHVARRVLETGDVVLLVAGGHGFVALDDSEMIEVKQGPFLGEEDKRRFVAKGSQT